MTSHKDLQVAKQVFEALSIALADLDDPVLDDLALAAVDPAPDASRLLVTLIATRPDADLEAARAAIDEVAGDLRADVAAELQRRRAPELSFRVVPAS